MSIVTYENVDTPVFELDTMRYLFRDGLQGMWVDFRDGYVFADTDLTIAPAPGEGIAGYLDRSGNGLNGTQPVITARPILGRVPVGGRRNLLVGTDNFIPQNWVGRTGFSVVETLSDEVCRVSAISETPGWTAMHGGSNNIVFSTAGLSFSVDLKADGSDTVVIGHNNISSFTRFSIDLVTGNVLYAQRPQIQNESVIPLEDGWFRCSFTLNVTLLGRPCIYLTDTPVTSSGSMEAITATVGSSVLVRRPQIDAGSVTPYQRVTTAYDITEAGVPSVYYAHYDGADDVLPSSLTIPSISEGCFILVGTAGIWIDNEWVNTTGTLTVGPATYTGGPSGILPVVGSILSIIWREEPLTEAEKAEVVRYGVKRGSPGEIE